MYDVFVIKGNVAIFKCNIPSFVSDHVEIIEWTDTEGGVYSTEAKFGITSKRKRLILKDTSIASLSLKSLFVN